MAPDDRLEDDTRDPLALVASIVEVVGIGVSIWYLYSILRRDPEFEAWRAKVGAWLHELRQRRRFANVSTVVPEAAYILTEAQQ
jgi:hypothetical protein